MAYIHSIFFHVILKSKLKNLKYYKIKQNYTVIHSLIEQKHALTSRHFSEQQELNQLSPSKIQESLLILPPLTYNIVT